MNMAEFETYRQAAEWERSQSIPATSLSFEIASQQVFFPKKLVGKTIVDIGSGASTVLFELRMRGANAYGIDPLYRDLDLLKESSDRYISDPNLASGEDYFPRINGQKGPWEQLFILEEKRNTKSFYKNLAAQNPLIAGMAGYLPIATNSCDFVYSLSSISPGLKDNLIVYSGCIIEGHRILAPDGEFNIYPFWTSEPSSQRVIAAMKQLNMRHKISPSFTDPTSATLRIFK